MINANKTRTDNIIFFMSCLCVCGCRSRVWDTFIIFTCGIRFVFFLALEKPECYVIERSYRYPCWNARYIIYAAKMYRHQVHYFFHAFFEIWLDFIMVSVFQVPEYLKIEHSDNALRYSNLVP